MKQPKKPKSYAELRNEWYKKLEDDGFKDIEADEYNFKSGWQSSRFKKDALTQNGGWQAKATYYTMAEHFINDHTFENELERIIWEYHAHGISVREIAQILNDTKVKKTNHMTVWQVVDRLAKIMKHMYMPEYRSRGSKNVQ